DVRPEVPTNQHVLGGRAVAIVGVVEAAAIARARRRRPSPSGGAGQRIVAGEVDALEEQQRRVGADRVTLAGADRRRGAARRHQADVAAPEDIALETNGGEI